MEFTINQKDFSGSVYRSIWQVVMFMAPLHEVIPEEFEDGDKKKLLQGERNLYKFFLDLYSDMYEDPENYFIPVGEYDQFINDESNRNLATYKQKESTLRNEYQQAIQLFQHLLFALGKKAELNNSLSDSYNSSVLCIEGEDYQNILNNLKLRKVKGEEE